VNGYVSRKLYVRLRENLAKAEEIANQSSFNYIEGNGSWGVICNGVSYTYVSDALHDLGLENEAAILRLGFTRPLPKQLIRDFLASCEKEWARYQGKSSEAV